MSSCWYLEHVTTRHKIILHKGKNVIGRHSRCRIVLGAPYEFVSREHVNIEIVNDDKVIVKSLNALNGVFINQGVLDDKVKSIQVLEGSTISLGVEGPPINVKPEFAMFFLRKTAPVEEAVVLSSDDEDTNPLPPLKKPLSAKESTEFNLEKQLNNGGGKSQNLHLPKLPEVKQELMQQTSDEITNIFGEPDEAILGGVLNINPYIYNALNAKSGAHMSTDKKMHDGDLIELDTISENSDMPPPAPALPAPTLPAPALPAPALPATALPAQNKKASDDFDERFEFSQAVLQEMKEEMAFNEGEEDFLGMNGLELGEPESPSSLLGEDDIVISDDDDDFNASAWSEKLHSQKPMSQVYPMSQAYPMDTGSGGESEMQLKAPPKPLCIDSSSSEDDEIFSGLRRKADSTSFIRKCYVRLEPIPQQPEISSTVEEPQLFTRRHKKRSSDEDTSQELFQRRPANKKRHVSDIPSILDDDDVFEKDIVVPDQPSTSSHKVDNKSEKSKVQSRSKSEAYRESVETPTTSKKFIQEKISIPNIEVEKGSEKSKIRSRTNSVACRRELDAQTSTTSEKVVSEKRSSSKHGASEKSKTRSRSKSVSCREDLEAESPTTSKKVISEKLHEAEKSSEKSKIRSRSKSVACLKDLDDETPTTSKKCIAERQSSRIVGDKSSDKSKIRSRSKSLACREDLDAEAPSTSKKLAAERSSTRKVDNEKKSEESSSRKRTKSVSCEDLDADSPPSSKEKNTRLRSRSKSCYVEKPIMEELVPVEEPVKVNESHVPSNDGPSKEAPKPAESSTMPRISPRLQNRAKSCYIETSALPTQAKSDPKERVTDFKENRLNRGPSVIDAPSLPQHRGKHRGVSVEVKGQDKQKQCVLERQKLIDYQKQMNDKWHQKPMDKKKEDQEIKDRRREALKKLAEKPKEQEKPCVEKRKIVTSVPTVNNSNRGEFLTREIEGPPPKVPKKDSPKKDPSPPPPKTPMAPPRRPTIESFSQQLMAADEVTINQPKRGSRPPERREAQVARNQRTVNRCTFEDMERYNELIEAINNRSKQVRFDDKVKIFYYEMATLMPHEPEKVRGRKDSTKLAISTYTDRKEWTLKEKGKAVNDIRHHSRTILEWANQWLQHRSVDAVAATDVLIPIPQDFPNFKQYKNIIVPLMKLELLSTIERDYQSSNATFEVGLEEVLPEEGNCYRLITRVNGRPIGRFTLYTLKSGNELPETFGNLQDQKCIGGTTYNMTFDILTQNIPLETMKRIKRITVRPVIDSLRIELGAMSAVDQLFRSPLCERILRPARATMPFRVSTTGPTFSYKGFDRLNDHQEDIILKTYQRVINYAHPSLTLIQGPPGTGKSAVISNLTLQCLYGNAANNLDQKILICAHSNTAIDRIVSSLSAVKSKMSRMHFELLRFGLFEKMSDQARLFSLEARYQSRRDQKLKVLSPEEIAVLRKQYSDLKSDIIKLKAKPNLGTTYLQQELQKKEKQFQLVSEKLQPRLTQRDEFDIAKTSINGANIVCTTLSSCVKLANYIEYFDICIIDEATQCTEPWTLLPIRFGLRHLVLVGDTQQLPAVVLSQKAIEYGLSNSMFDRIQRSLEKQLESPGSNQFIHTKLFKLSVQYRMHPEICRWPNKYFYEDQLVSAPCTEKREALIPYCVINLSYTRDTSTMSNKSIRNDEEARFVAKLITEMQKLMPATRYSYGLITPYSNQCYALSQVITEKMKVKPLTIDAYQGLEKDVVILSNARTRGCGFLSNYHRLNVALTRPKRCLVICGNFDDLQSVDMWRQLLDDARQRNVYFDLERKDADDLTSLMEKMTTKGAPPKQ
ncbi:hypothetical protein KR026_012193 [Drosophila bipectinata]|nr:hypothetical protein KR026_012193 [Drosophila bipectinata]